MPQAAAGAKDDLAAAALAERKGDYTLELKLIRPLAEQGNADAQFALGSMYCNGYGVPQDCNQAETWYRKGVDGYRKAAEQGDADGQFKLGVRYERGEGVARDYAQALLWYRKAAEQGDAVAQQTLGSMYEDGKGVPQDYVLAYMWYNLAAAQSFGVAAELRNFLAKSMTPEQIADAQKLAREWKSTTPTK